MRPEVLRLARGARWAALAGLSVIILAAAVAWLSLSSLHPVVRGEGPAGQAITITGPSRSGTTSLDLLGHGVTDLDSVDCPREPSQLRVFQLRPMFSGSSVEVNGEVLPWIGNTLSKWAPGDVIPACAGDGLQSVVVVEDPRPERRFFALGFTFGAAFLAVWTVILFALARSTPRTTHRGMDSIIYGHKNPYEGDNS